MLVLNVQKLQVHFDSTKIKVILIYSNKLLFLPGASKMPKEAVSILWFRNGLRLHDNKSLAKAVEDNNTKLLPIFIFDGETPTTK